MSKLSWTIVCCLVIVNSAALVAGFNRDVRGMGCGGECTEVAKPVSECGHIGPTGACMYDVCHNWVYTYAQCNTDAESSVDYCELAHPVPYPAPNTTYDYYPDQICFSFLPGPTTHPAPECSGASTFNTRCDIAGCPFSIHSVPGQKAELTGSICGCR